MIPLADIFAAAAKSHTVRRVAVAVVVVAVALVGVRLVFGSDVKIVTQDASDCAVTLADKSARLELTNKAMESCSRALDFCAKGTP